MEEAEMDDFDVAEAAGTVVSVTRNDTFRRAFLAAVRALPGRDAACYRASRRGREAVAAAKAEFGLDDAGFAEAAARGRAQADALPEARALAVLVHRNRPSTR